jgi:hypothetical protein
MRIAVLALALLPAAAIAQDHGAAPAPAPLAAKKQCENARAQWAAPAQAPVRARPLNQEPLADQYRPVLRLVGGCDMPVKIREDIGRIQR